MNWFISTAIAGLLAGLIARGIMPGKDKMGWLFTILLGIGGSFVGGFIGDAVGIVPNGRLGHLVVASAGALLILAIARRLREKK